MKNLINKVNVVEKIENEIRDYAKRNGKDEKWIQREMEIAGIAVGDGI